LRHLYKSREILASRLNTLHNLHYYLSLMRRIRAAVESGTYASFLSAFRAGEGRADRTDVSATEEDPFRGR
jgi:queuine tRNA-ribosyltransferase